MDKNRKTAIILSLLGVVILGLLYFLATRNPHYLWNETYVDNGDQPYDLSLFKQTLKESTDDFLVLDGLFADTSYLEKEGGTIIYIAGYAGIDSLEAARLNQFMEKGNKVLISSRSPGQILERMAVCNMPEDSLFSESLESDSVRILDQNGSFSFSYDVYNEPVLHDWVFFKALDCFQAAGQIEIEGIEFPNLVELQMGKGRLILHSTPLIFTNYHFRTERVFEHVNLLTESAEGDMYYYLEPEIYYPDYADSNSPNIGESPLRFVLNHPSLKWAWYATIALALFYVINSMRRPQRAIPVVSLPENQTAAHLDMVFQLFKKEGSHRDIVQGQVKLLQSHLRRKYNLNATKLNKDFYESATAKLKLEKNYIQQFFNKLERSRYNSTLSDSELIDIDREITEFYQRCP